jgi:hypothetical protein
MGNRGTERVEMPVGFVLRTMDATDMLPNTSANQLVKGYSWACGEYGDRSTSTDIPSMSP